jgi:hypothetical protein
VALIRAVNALQRLGKVRALETLTKYAELAGNFDDGEIVFWIIHALFEPIRVGDRIPGPMIAVWLDEEALPEAAKWPLNPIAVVNDVPFMLGRQIALGGVPEPPSMHIEWARRHGVVRDQPLWPDVNPLLAAETILGSQQFQQLDEIARDEATRLVRAQAYAMVAGLLPAVPMDAQHDLDDEVQWRSRVEESAAREIHWDAETEQFVVKGR